MKAVGVVGPSGAGKTTLAERLLPELDGRIAAVKSIHHDVEVDEPGKDTHRLRTAGAEAVVGVTPAYAFEIGRGGKGDDGAAALRSALDGLADRGFDGVVVEGFSASALPVIAVGDVPDATGGEVVARAGRRAVGDPAPYAEALSRLREYATPASVVDALGGSGVAAALSADVSLAGDPRAWVAPPDRLDGALGAVRESLGRHDGVLEARAVDVPPVAVGVGSVRVVAGVRARDRDAAFAALAAGCDRLAEAVGEPRDETYLLRA